MIIYINKKSSDNVQSLQTTPLPSNDQFRIMDFDQVFNKQDHVFQPDDDLLVQINHIQLDYPLEKSGITTRNFLVSHSQLTSTLPSTTIQFLSQLLSHVPILDTIAGLALEMSEVVCLWPTDKKHMFVYVVTSKLESKVRYTWDVNYQGIGLKDVISVFIEKSMDGDGPFSCDHGGNCGLKRNKFEQGGRDCAICLQEILMAKTGSAARLPCSHFYHRRCIGKWFLKSNFCPMCRVRVFSRGN